MTPRPRIRAGVSLLELIMVLALMGILAGLALPMMNPGIHDQLQGAAQVLAAELNYARGLAVANNSRYRITADTANNRFILEHSGSDTALNSLPVTPFHQPSQAAAQQVLNLADLPGVGGRVALVAVLTGADGRSPAANVEFDPLGATMSAEATIIWLAAGSGDATRYITIGVNPVTGLAVVGDFQATGPATLAGS